MQRGARQRASPKDIVLIEYGDRQNASSDPERSTFRSNNYHTSYYSLEVSGTMGGAMTPPHLVLLMSRNLLPPASSTPVGGDMAPSSRIAQWPLDMNSFFRQNAPCSTFRLTAQHRWWLTITIQTLDFYQESKQQDHSGANVQPVPYLSTGC